MYLIYSNLTFSQERQKANTSCRKRHFVDEKQEEDSKRCRSELTRSELMDMIVRELERRFGPNWESYLPIEVDLRASLYE